MSNETLNEENDTKNNGALAGPAERCVMRLAEKYLSDDKRTADLIISIISGVISLVSLAHIVTANRKLFFVPIIFTLATTLCFYAALSWANRLKR